MKQTAVKWLADEITKRGPTENNPPQWLIELYEQANEMFEQQIEDAYRSGVYDGGKNVSQYNMNAEQYYNETFNK
jgi:hypothetical protein